MYEPTQDHIDRWNRGWSCKRLSEIAGVSRATVCRAMKRKGLDLLDRPKPLIIEAIKTSEQLKREGLSMRKISDKVGYSVRQIQRWLNP